MSKVGKGQAASLAANSTNKGIRCVVCTKSLSASSISKNSSPRPRSMWKNNYNEKEKDDEDENESRVFEEPSALKRAMGKIFKYLAVKPDEVGTTPEDLSEEWANKPFCLRCFEIVDSVANLHVKILELELMIQEKVEALGGIVRNSVSKAQYIAAATHYGHLCKLVTQSPKIDAWTKIRKYVAYRYDHGMFPSPRVTLKDLVSKEREPTEGTAAEQNNVTVNSPKAAQPQEISMNQDESTEIPHNDPFDEIAEDFNQIQLPQIQDIDMLENVDHDYVKNTGHTGANQNYPQLVLVAEVEIPMSQAGTDFIIINDASSRTGNGTETLQLQAASQESGILENQTNINYLRPSDNDIPSQGYYSNEGWDCSSGNSKSREIESTPQESTISRGIIEAKGDLPEIFPTESYCPREGCDFKAPVILSDKTQQAGRKKHSQAVMVARKRVQSHYMVEHLGVKMEDVQGSESTGFYYACKLCEFTTPCKSPGHGYAITYQPRRKLAHHYMRKHEKPLRKEERIKRTYHPPKWKLKTSEQISNGTSRAIAGSRKPKKSLNLQKPVKTRQLKLSVPKPKRITKKREFTFLPETLYDTKNFGCPLCPFKPEFDENWRGHRRTYYYQRASSKLTSHYAANHLPVTLEDAKLDPGSKLYFFTCTLCDYKTEKRKDKHSVRNRLCRHYIRIHHGGMITKNLERNEKNEIVVKPRRSRKMKTPAINGAEISIPCLVSRCNFSTTFVDCTDVMARGRRKRAALIKLSNHNIIEHDFPEKDLPESDRTVFGKCMEVIDQMDVFKCYRCDLLLKVDYPDPAKIVNDPEVIALENKIARLTAHDKFMTHYIPHILPEGVLSYKPTPFVEDISAVRTAIKCQHCNFVVKKKKSWKTHGKGKLLVANMKNNLRRHHKFEHPDLPFPEYRYHMTKKNLIKFNQEDFTKNNEDDVIYSSESDVDVDVEFEIEPEKKRKRGPYKKRTKKSVKENIESENTETETEAEMSEEEICYIDDMDEIEIKSEEPSDSDSEEIEPGVL